MEDATADYLSFTVAFPDGNHRAYAWKEGEAVEVFSFANTGACLAAVELLDNSDPFMAAENSMSTNPGNQIDVMGLDEGSVYLGNYDTGSADCTTPDGKVVQKSFIFLPLINR